VAWRGPKEDVERLGTEADVGEDKKKLEEGFFQKKAVEGGAKRESERSKKKVVSRRSFTALRREYCSREGKEVAKTTGEGRRQKLEYEISSTGKTG